MEEKQLMLDTLFLTIFLTLANLLLEENPVLSYPTNDTAQSFLLSGKVCPFLRRL